MSSKFVQHECEHPLSHCKLMHTSTLALFFVILIGLSCTPEFRRVCSIGPQDRQESLPLTLFAASNVMWRYFALVGIAPCGFPSLISSLPICVSFFRLGNVCRSSAMLHRRAKDHMIGEKMSARKYATSEVHPQAVCSSYS